MKWKINFPMKYTFKQLQSCSAECRILVQKSCLHQKDGSAQFRHSVEQINLAIHQNQTKADTGNVMTMHCLRLKLTAHCPSTFPDLTSSV